MISRLFLGVTGTVVAAITGAYVFWGQTKKKRPNGKCQGLVNVGNSCFLNCLLQSWAACPSLYSWLRQSISHTSNTDERLANIIYKILQVLNNEVEDAPDPYNPSRVFHALRQRRWLITSDEQDAHELFHVLTESLDEETTRYPTVLSLFDVKHLQDPQNKYQPKLAACTRSRGLLPVLPERNIEQPTRGLLASQLQCLTCGSRSPVKYDVFDSLSLSFPRNYWGPLSLDNLFRHFISPEIVQSVDCAGCAAMSHKKEVKSNFRKKVSIGKLPQVLCVHLNRTQWLDNGATVKRYDHVSFPETLHMDKYLFAYQDKGAGDVTGLMGGADLTLQILSQTVRSPPAPASGPVNLLRTLNYDQQLTRTGLFVHPNMSPQIPQELSDVNHNAPPELVNSGHCDFAYRLAAVVCHLGDTQLGHFVAYRRGTHDGVSAGAGGLGSRWWLTSDASVRRVSVDQVTSSEAYMLFYERL